MLRTSLISVFLLCLSLSTFTFGESQETEGQGINDPFGDPSNYEFSEDEKANKEFFHLGRYFMFELDLGYGIFTGGLGSTTSPGFYVGGDIVYFFDSQIALEAAIHYSPHMDTIPAIGGTVTVDTQLTQFTAAFRYYFNVQGAPKFIAIANPYLVVGTGMYLRYQGVISNPGGISIQNEGTSSNLGVFGGMGVEFLVYRKTFYVGASLRYHYLFFPDKNDTLGGKVPAGSRAGDYFVPTLTLTYNF